MRTHMMPVAGLLAAFFLAPLSGSRSLADEVVFDLPSSIECRDVTTREFASTNPRSKVIEAKVRISAREIATSEILQIDYEIRTGVGMRVVDYLPKTTLESSVVADQIDITAANENSQANSAEAGVAYKPAILGGSHNTTAKKSEAKHFKQLAAKEVILASGTIDREHGVFFHVRPSLSASFEGSREFFVVAVVPRGWRGDICHISCTAKIARHSMLSTSAASLGNQRTAIGMYLRGDAQAAVVAEQLRSAQNQYEQLAGGPERKPKLIEAMSGVFSRGAQQRRMSVEEAAKSLNAVQALLKQLSADTAG